MPKMTKRPPRRGKVHLTIHAAFTSLLAMTRSHEINSTDLGESKVFIKNMGFKCMPVLFPIQVKL